MTKAARYRRQEAKGVVRLVREYKRMPPTLCRELPGPGVFGNVVESWLMEAVK